MTRNTTMKRTQDQVAEMENEGQGQQQEATPPEVGVGVTVAPSSSPATDAATDQDVDTAAVGLDRLAEQKPHAKTPPRATAQGDGAPGDGPPPGGKDGDRARGVLVAGD
jgi:hypothetical protein